MGAPLLSDAGKAEGARERPHPTWPTVAVLGVVGLLLLGSFAALRVPTESTPQTALAAIRPGLAPQLGRAAAPGRAVAMPSNAYSRLALGQPSRIQMLAIEAVEASSRRCGVPRDLSAMAEKDSGAQEAAGAAKAALKAEDLAGITAPMGLWDPWGLTAKAKPGKLLFYREAELKHGRVCMLAALGFLVGEKFHPLFGGNIDVPSYVAFQQTPLQAFWPIVLILMLPFEYRSIQTFSENLGSWTTKEDRIPGDLGFDPLGFKPKNDKEFRTLQNKELNNGRLAMISVAGMIAQELATGQKLR